MPGYPLSRSAMLAGARHAYRLVDHATPWEDLPPSEQEAWAEDVGDVLRVAMQHWQPTERQVMAGFAVQARGGLMRDVLVTAVSREEGE